MPFLFSCIVQFNDLPSRLLLSKILDAVVISWVRFIVFLLVTSTLLPTLSLSVHLSSFSPFVRPCHRLFLILTQEDAKHGCTAPTTLDFEILANCETSDTIWPAAKNAQLKRRVMATGLRSPFTSHVVWRRRWAIMLIKLLCSRYSETNLLKKNRNRVYQRHDVFRSHSNHWADKTEPNYNNAICRQETETRCNRWQLNSVSRTSVGLKQTDEHNRH